MGVGAALVTAAVVGAVSAAGSAAYSVHQGREQKKDAKKLQHTQEKAIAEQKAEALETRRNQIDAQRNQLSGSFGSGGYSINRTSGKGRATSRTSGDLLG